MELVITLLADGLMLPIVALAIYALLRKVAGEDRYDTYVRILMAGISSYMLAKFIGALWQPEKLRPFERLGVDAGAAYLNNPGFPSDHVLFATFLTLAVWFGTRNRKITVILSIMTLLVAMGRVGAYVHTPLDVVGGVVIAFIGGIWYAPMVKSLHRQRLAKKAKK